MLFHLRKIRFHPNEFRRKLLEASFENFIRDDSNDRAFKILYAIGESGHLEGSRMILSGPKDVGKTHLIHALLGRLLEKNPKLKVIKITGEDFLSHIILEACNGIYGNIEGYLDTLYSSDVLIIEDINYLSRQLKGGSLAKKTLCQFLDRRSLSDKLLILTVDSSGDGITDDGLNARFKEFHAVTIGQQNKALLQKWLHNILSDADFRLNARDADALVASSTSVRELKNCLLRWLAEHTDLYRHLIPGLPKKETEMIV